MLGLLRQGIRPSVFATGASGLPNSSVLLVIRRRHVDTECVRKLARELSRFTTRQIDE
jgi:hypothetical protein